MKLRSALMIAEPVLAAAFGTLLVAFVVATSRMRDFAVSTSDFQDYCFAVKSFGMGRWDLWPSQRSVAAGALAGLLGPSQGTMGALALASLIATFGWMVALYRWAWALGGRRAAWLTLAWTASFGPLVLLTRTISFYPMIALYQVAAAAAVAGALARGTKGWLVVSPVLLGLLPLADLRSVLFLLALLPTAVLAGVVAPASRPIRAAAALAPVLAVALAWRFGAWAYPGDSASLQSAVFRYAEDAARLTGVAWVPPDGDHSPAFRWAHASPATIIDALKYLRSVEASRPAALVARAAFLPHAKELRALFPLLAVGAAFALVSLRRPRAFAAFVLTAAPFVLVLRSALITLPHPRQLGLGAFVLPLVLGLGSAGILQVIGALRRRLTLRWPSLGSVPGTVVDGVLGGLAVLFVATILAGWVPSPFGPLKRWRATLGAEDEPRVSIAAARELAGSPPGTPGDPARMCAMPLRDDLEAGRPIEVPWFPGAPASPGPATRSADH